MFALQHFAETLATAAEEAHHGFADERRLIAQTAFVQNVHDGGFQLGTADDGSVYDERHPQFPVVFRRQAAFEQTTVFVNQRLLGNDVFQQEEVERQEGLFADRQHDMAVQNHVSDHRQVVFDGHGADEAVEVPQEPVAFRQKFQKRLATGETEHVAERRFVAVEGQAEQGGLHLPYLLLLPFDFLRMGRRMRDHAAQIIRKLSERLGLQAFISRAHGLAQQIGIAA